MVLFVSEVQCSREESGKWVNQYQLLQDLGQGTYCKVKLATTKQGTTHAIKRLSRHVLESRLVAKYDADGATQVPFRECIEEEIRILAELSHPHVVRLEEVIDCLSHDSLYMVYEGLPGKELMVWIEGSLAYSASAQGPVSSYWGNAVRQGEYHPDTTHREVLIFQEELIRYFGCQLAQGLAYIHEKGIIHKDLKPDNLVLTKPIPACDPRFVASLRLRDWPNLPTPSVEALPTTDGRSLQELLASAGLAVKIADFNSAESCKGPDFLIYDANGTQEFTPPELFEGHSDGIPGKPRDMWSLGCVFFILAFGRCPYWAELPLELQLKIMQGELELPVGGPGSSELRRLISSLLSQSPSARPSAKALLQSPWLTSPPALLGA